MRKCQRIAFYPLMAGKVALTYSEYNDMWLYNKSDLQCRCFLTQNTAVTFKRTFTQRPQDTSEILS